MNAYLNECFAKACEIEAIDGKHKIPINPNDWFVNKYYEKNDETEDLPEFSRKWKIFYFKRFYGYIKDMEIWRQPVDYRCKVRSLCNRLLAFFKNHFRLIEVLKILTVLVFKFWHHQTVRGNEL